MKTIEYENDKQELVEYFLDEAQEMKNQLREEYGDTEITLFYENKLDEDLQEILELVTSTHPLALADQAFLWRPAKNQFAESLYQYFYYNA